MDPADLRHLCSAFYACERMDKAETEAGLRGILGAALAEFGYAHFLMVSSRIQHAVFEKMMILETWPAAWIRQYVRDNMLQADPVATLARTSFDAFAWDEAPITGARARRVMDISAQDHGLKRGFCVPIHGTGGYQATVTMGGHDVDTSRQARKAIEMMAFYAFKTDLKLKSQTRKPLLSPREREVMRWAAAGKSAWDTGEILHISEQTVKKHMSAVLAKLDVCSKMQAIAESIRRGEIAP